MNGNEYVCGYNLFVVDNDLVKKYFFEYKDRVRMYKDAIEYKKSGKRVYVGEISPDCELYKNDDFERPKIFSFDYRNSVLTHGLETNCSSIIQNMALLLHGKEHGRSMCRNIDAIIIGIEEMNENLKYLKEALDEYRKEIFMG